MTFPSTLIIGSHVEAQIQALLTSLNHADITNNPDIFIPDDYSIVSIRQIASFLSKKPISHDSKIVLINHANLLQNESQNAILKLLEEPGPNNYFILTAKSSGQLLSTIVSRCRLINCYTTPAVTLSQLKFNLSATKALMLSDQILQANPNLDVFLNQEITYYQQQLIVNPDLKTKNIISLILKATDMLSSNIDKKFVLDYLLLNKI